ncbi:MAG TPA: sigma-54 dependent transcriptional regulator [Gemmatimonadaceae bacterium]|nr:sigma-54 dependent transcriptional regulator [Gemmatimonadaceae bacterium]
MDKPKILIADDERSIAQGLSAVLEEEGYAVDVATDGQKALESLLGGTFGVILADLKMPKLDGLALLQEMQAREVTSECIIITGQATVDSAVQAMRQGAYDYIEKPLTAEKLNRLKALIPKALEKFQVKQTNRALASELQALTHYGELTGQSDAMRGVYQVIDAVAPSTASVLILGESGTGKELVARAIHQKSERARGPFLALNCAALPKDILENELFGHEKGAFTGSTNEKPGAFEMAHEGTLFLDEVAEMAPDIQVKLLRALESRQVRRLGGKKEIDVDIRVVAATNRDLQQALAEAELREDLYYRLAVVELYLPPLRERMGDLKLLATEFLARFSQQNNKKLTGFDDAAMDWILSYQWPGNVRELKNAVERAVIMSRSPSISLGDVVPRHLRNSTDVQSPVSLPVGSTFAEARRQLTLKTFSMTGGDIERTAHMLGTTSADVRAELAVLVSATEAHAKPEAAARNVKSYGSVKEKDAVRQKSKGRR